jgi:hypothetical protein
MKQFAAIAGVGAVVALGAGAYAWSELVPGTPVSLEILPSTELLLTPTAQAQLSARVTDARGRIVNVRPSWNGDIAVGADGAIVAPDKTGTYYLDAVVGDVRSSAKLIVKPGPPHSLRVLPARATVKPRDTVAFAATAFDEWGNSAPIKPSWRVSAGGGSVNEQGIFVAGLSGTATITADIDGFSASATATTQCAPPRTESAAGLTFTVICGAYADVWTNGTGLSSPTVTRTVDEAVSSVEMTFGRQFRQRLTVTAFANKASFDLGLKQLYRVDALPYEEGVFVAPAFVAVDWDAPDGPEVVTRHEITHLAVAQAAGRQPIPYWLHEGLATLSEFPVAEDAAVVSRYCTASAAKNARLPTLSEIGSRDGWTSYVNEVGAIAYHVSAQLSSFLALDAKGDLNLLDKMAGGLPVESAYQAASGKSFEAFTADLPDRARSLADRYPGLAFAQRDDGRTFYVAFGQPSGARVTIDIRNNLYYGGGSKTANAYGCVIGYLDSGWPHGTYTVTMTGPAGNATAIVRH